MVKNGHNKLTGKQQYRCRDCQKYFQLDYDNHGCEPDIKEKIINMAMNASGI